MSKRAGALVLHDPPWKALVYHESQFFLEGWVLYLIVSCCDFLFLHKLCQGPALLCRAWPSRLHCTRLMDGFTFF